MKTFSSIFFFVIKRIALCMIVMPLFAQEGDVFEKRIHLPKSKGSIYQLLNLITDKSEYLFIYDSKVLNNEQKAKIAKGTYSIREAIHCITGNNQLGMRVVGRHILLYNHAEAEKSTIVAKPIRRDSTDFVVVEGTVHDRLNKEVIPFASVNVLNSSIGTISNQNGAFRLKIPDSLRYSILHISHIGYHPLDIEINLLEGNNTQLYLDTRVVSIQEIVVSIVNPVSLIAEMLEQIKTNYPVKPSYLTSFYREGIEYKKRFVSLTEAVFKIYKTEYYHLPSDDQVKLLKMRRITNDAITDTVLLKMKSGINASLMLDLVKNIPDFLTLEEVNNYKYTKTDLTIVDGRLTHVISFEQNKGIDKPLYKGDLYIDVLNKALLRVNFEINPAHIKQASDMLIVKKSRNYKLEPQTVKYTVSYEQMNGKYYINHIRGDLEFKVKKKNQLFTTSPLHTWFEMATCKIDTMQVTRFTRNETLPTRTIFAETDFSYDEKFWGDFNVILPEEKLNEAITRVSSKIEETGF